jgi:hypothetical protein
MAVPQVNASMQVHQVSFAPPRQPGHQLLDRCIGDHPQGRSDDRRKACQHRCLERVHLGQPARRRGTVPDPARIRRDHGGVHQRLQQRPLQASGGFHHDERRTHLAQLRDQRRYPGPSPRVMRTAPSTAVSSS